MFQAISDECSRYELGQITVSELRRNLITILGEYKIINDTQDDEFNKLVNRLR